MQTSKIQAIESDSKKVGPYSPQDFYNMLSFARNATTLAKAGEEIQVGPKIKATHGFASPEFAQSSIGPAQRIADDIINRGKQKPLASTDKIKSEEESALELIQLAQSSIAQQVPHAEIVKQAKSAAAVEFADDDKKAIDARECLAAMAEVITLMREAAEDPLDDFNYDQFIKRFSKGEYELIEVITKGAKEGFSGNWESKRTAVQLRRDKTIDALKRAHNTKAWTEYQAIFSAAQLGLTIVGGAIGVSAIVVCTLATLVIVESLTGHKGKGWIASQIARGDQESEQKWVERLHVLSAVATAAASIAGLAWGTGIAAEGAVAQYLSASVSAGQAITTGMVAKESYQSNREEASLSELSFDLKMKEDKVMKSIKGIDKSVSLYLELTKKLFNIAMKDQQFLTLVMRNR